jgi:hypothetical protein
MAETVSVLLTLQSVILAGQIAGFAFAARQLPAAGGAGRIDQSSHISSTPAAGIRRDPGCASPECRRMARMSMILGLILILLVGGGVVFLASWDIPAPRAKVEKVIPADRLGK